MKALVFAVLLACSCSDSEPPPPVAETYMVRGAVTAMPDGERSKEVEIHHEAIPLFRNQQGKVAEMSSMQMSFAPTSGVLLAGVVVGDKVAFTFQVVWEDRRPLRLTKIEKLPADTKLLLE